MADAMDSKSISRKGVGVQVPASAPIAPDELARALVPVLLHKLNNTTQYLSALQAWIAEPPLDEAPTSQPGAFEGLSETALEVDDLGWILGLVANAGGADVLLERRERSRLGPLVRLVADCLRKNRRDLERPARDLPLLDVSADVGSWRIPWAIARWLHASGMSSPVGTTLEWDIVEREPDRFALVCSTSDAKRMMEFGDTLRVFDPRLEPRSIDGACALLLPAGALSMQAREKPSGISS